MKKCLTAVGIRPISNIVDITNFVMMEMGVPLHAFDIRNLEGGSIVVRRAGPGESIVALDGKKYELTENDLCICDARKPVAIAGIMGGEYSGIQPDTTTVVLESAYFDPDSIRSTSRRLGLASDASFRYERGVDREAVLKAGIRAMELIRKFAGGEVLSLSIAEQPAPDPRRIRADFNRIRDLLGMETEDETIVRILSDLGFRREEGQTFVVPSWRTGDVVGEADLAEEVARIHGLDKIPVVPIRAVSEDYAMDACKVFEKLRAELTACGLDEIVCGSLIDERSAVADGIFTPDDLIRLNNPISLDLAVPRPSLLPGMIATVKRNAARRNCDMALFEIGHVFCANPEKFPEERDELVIAMTGKRHPERYSAEKREEYDFFDLKGTLEMLLELRRVQSFSFEAAEDPRFVKGCCALLKIDRKPAGVFGRFVPALTRGIKTTAPLYGAVIQLAGLLSAKEKSILCQPVSAFPAVTRDVAFIAPESLENKKVLEFIRNAHVPNLEEVELFDLFKNESLGAGRKSMAYSLVFRSLDRTLTDDEVNQAHEKLRTKLEKGLSVELR